VNMFLCVVIKCRINILIIFISVETLSRKLYLALKRNEQLIVRLRRARFDSRMGRKVKYVLRKESSK
jgi:hypothetical protein